MSISYPVHLRHANPVLDVGLPPRTVTDGSLQVLELAVLAVLASDIISSVTFSTVLSFPTHLQ